MALTRPSKVAQVLLCAAAFVQIASTAGLPSKRLTRRSRTLLQVHDAAYQRWVPAQGAHTGCECLPQWSYTSSKGQKYTINGTCANPGNDWPTDWCYVNPMTCQHKPFLANNGQLTQAWDTCMAPGMNTTIDAEKTLDYCSCLANYTYVSNGTTYHSDGGCIQDDPDIPPWCIVYQKSCSQPPPKKPDGQFWDICRGIQYDIRQAAAAQPTGPPLPRPETATGCQCLPHWNFTNSQTNETTTFNGTCASPGSKSAGPWCYVEPQTCKHQPLKDQTNQSYDNCATNSSTHTLDTAKTVNYCNCLPSYNYTANGHAFETNNGSCIRTNASELPWCFVVEDTCITPVLHRAGLGRNDSAWDTCLTTNEQLSALPPATNTSTAAASPGAAAAGVNLKAVEIAVPIAFVVFVLLHIPLCYWFVGMLKKRKQQKLQAEKGDNDARPWGVDVLQAYMDKQLGKEPKDDEQGSGGKIIAGMPNSPTNGSHGTNGTSETEGLISGRKASRQYSGASSLPEVVPSSSWEIKPEDIVIAKHSDGSDWEIGSGGFGKVYRAEWRNIQSVAVKQLKQHDARNDIRFLREIAILKECRSGHVVQFLGACVAPGSTMLVCELMEGGSVHDALRAGQLAWPDGKDIVLDVARGLSYLHSQRIAHLDIKSGNVLLTREGKAKIADVGLAQMVQTTHISNLNGMGTFAYAAPELLTGGKCNEVADIFSFGVLLWELVTGEMPRRGKLRDLRVPEECTEEVRELIDLCMRTNVNERPSAMDIVNRLQVLPAQPSTRVKREGSTQSFKSPLDQANASSDQSSSELTSSNGSTDRSNVKFYNSNASSGWTGSAGDSQSLPLIKEQQETSPFTQAATEVPSQADSSDTASHSQAGPRNPATDALEAAKAVNAGHSLDGMPESTESAEASHATDAPKA